MTQIPAAPSIRDTPHPYYGAEAEASYQTECETLDELIAWANSYDEDMNFVYRWDWIVPTEQDIRLAAEDDEEIPRETLTLFVVLQRKSRFLNVTAPVTAADEPKVREFLTSDRILGALRRTWAPLLDPVDTHTVTEWAAVERGEEFFTKPDLNRSMAESDVRANDAAGLDSYLGKREVRYGPWVEVTD